ncbi:MAG: 5'-nucleotidase C-terminal domain-containing protein [Lachnospiraceae bacterium]|nr:5'-nucleotidase C-terminal domain-containing protein [Lachnospiraceae bacterium]
MVFKRLTAFVSVLLLLVMPAVQAFGESGQEIVGTVPRLLTATSDRDARCVECTMGNAVADAMCKYLNTDIAIACGGDFKANLPAGDITWDELQSAFAKDRTLATAAVSVRQLREILEAGVSHIQMNESERIDEAASVYDGFPQISGFTLYYDASAPVGQRVYDIYINDERLALDDDSRMFTLAATEFMLEGGYGLPRVEDSVSTDMTLADVTAHYIKDGMAEYLKTGERIHPMGTADGVLPGAAIGVIIAVSLVVFLLGRRNGRKKWDDESTYYPHI